ncbi:hypothetical protein BCR42DRAFT_67634 [Absidia repens]|uniref:PH domain-containing protein n=1 Tax=Absidia repens TaxID=90262 RepID=A0A1X2IDG0_9FUNG|nr:hypothetical protein BCR42DRAFT_67634 [Absidia repens]
MAYRNSLLSLYPSSPPIDATTNTTKADLTAQFEEELPATAPVFEGHLYLRTDKKQWQWRLFRFDGTSFTCLSTRKVKLPPNTHVDSPLNDQMLLQSLPSFTSTSLTSPLLATPKSRSRHKLHSSTTSPLASYYQLPKWTVDIVNISAVSVLKPSSSNGGSKKKKLPVLSQKQSRCFCVRTFDGNCYIMKAQKQKDLERWLFVLTKMWKFALAMKLQLSSQQPQHQQILQQQHQQSYVHSSSLISTQSQQQIMSQQHMQSQDSITLSRRHQRPQHTTLEESNIVNNPLSLMKSYQQMTSGISSHPTTTPASNTHHHTSKSTLDYEKRYQHPILSVEKSECIDAWRQSLCELMAYDSQLQVSVPPPIESIPDDDQVSIISDMTSISHRKPTLRRRASIASSSSKRSARSSKMKPRVNTAAPRLKKKRSNDVKNWIEPRKIDNHNGTAPLMPIGTSLAPISSSTPAAIPSTISQPHVPPPADTYHVGYFQDCQTTARSSSMTSLDLDGNDGRIDDENDDERKRLDHNDKINNKNTTTGMEDRHVKYHHSTRSKPINVTNANLQIPDTVGTTLSPSHHHYQQTSSNDAHPVHRSLDNIASSSANYIPSSLTTTSPLYSLAHIDTHQIQQDDEEEISLADLQRSLKRTNLQHASGAVPSSSSSTVPTHYRQVPYNHHHHQQQQQQQQHQHHAHQYHQYQHYAPSSSSGMPITAPAIPPIPCNNTSNQPAILSRPFIQTHRGGNSNGSSTDFYRQPNRKWKKQPDQQQQQQQKQHDQRRNSWASSCEQKKMIPLRQSVHLDTVHW